MGRLEQAAFARAVHALSELPPPEAPEVAFAGRSNAGKSSALNAIVGRRRLAFTSRTPGRTQQIVMFRLPGGQHLVDLPGYGYAKVPESIRRHWESTLAAYLRERPNLEGLVLIMDARHPLTPLDRRMLDWFAPTGRPIHCLLTKADKLGRQEAARTLADARRALRAWGERCSVQLFSSVGKTGVEEAEDVIAGWLRVFPKALEPETKNAPARRRGPRGRPAAGAPGGDRRRQAKKSPSGEARASTRRPRTKGDKHEAEMP